MTDASGGMIAFVPCRAGSQRVPRKNVRSFAGVEGGLLAIKLSQLGAASCFDQIMVSTNDPEVIVVVEAFSERTGAKIVLDHRPDHLCSSEATTDSVIDYAARLFDDAHLFWTHVTSPFVEARHYEEMVSAYQAGLADGIHDSLMAVTTLHTFLWDDNGPINYNRAVERWPRTQTLKPIFEVNSAAFVIATPLMRTLSDRVGTSPILHRLSHDSSLDIDWEPDFARAEAIYQGLHS